MKKIAQFNKLYTLCTLTLSGLSLAACGGGGTSEEATPTAQTKINAAVTMDTPDNVINGEKALYSTQLSAEISTFGMSAEPAQITAKYFSPQLSDVQANTLQSNSGCYEGLQLKAGEHCEDHYEITSTTDNVSYHGQLVYETTTGTVTTPIDIDFKPESDDLFNHSDIQVTSVGAFSPGLQTAIGIVNASAKVLQNPQIIFPESVRGYIHALNSITTLKSGQATTLKFETDNSAEALAALKAWKDQLDQASISNFLYVKTNEQRGQKVDLTPSFSLMTLSADNTQSEYHLNADNNLEKIITLKNLTSDPIHNLDAQFSPQIDGVSADFSLCTLPLAAGASCQVKLIVGQYVSNTGISSFETDITFVTDSKYQLDDITTTLAMDTNVKLNVDPLSALIHQHDNIIKLINNSNVNFKPSTLIDDYKIYDDAGVDISNQVNILSSSSCLLGKVVSPGASCSLIINPAVASTHPEPLKLVISNSNTVDEIILPQYSSNGISIDNERTPKTIATGKDLSIYLLLSPLEAKVLYGFKLPFDIPYTLDTSVKYSCQIGDKINVPCTAKLDISSSDLGLLSEITSVEVLWADSTTDSLTAQINIVDLNDPDASLEGLVYLSQLSQTPNNVITFDTEGLHINLTNNTNKVLQYLDATSPQWLQDIVDFQALDNMTILTANETQSVTLPLLAGKTIADLQQALVAHQAEVTNNNNPNASLEKVFGFSSNNAIDTFYPAISNLLYPTFDDGLLTQEVVFSQAGLRYIPIINTSNEAHTITFDHNLPTGVTLSQQTSSPEMTLCEDSMTLAGGAICYVAFDVTPDANEQSGNYFNLTLTPNIESELLATTLEMSFKTNFVNELSYAAPEAAINVPLTSTKHYDLKIINNEPYVDWLPSTDNANYRLTGDDLTGLQLTDSSLSPSCLSGAAVASGNYCYIGLEVSANSVPTDYGFALDMGNNSNLAQNDFNIGTVSIIDHGIASAELVANGQNITAVVAGESFDLLIHAPENWFTETATDQSFTISSSSPDILIDGAESGICTLSQSEQSLTCQVHVTTSGSLAVGSYTLNIYANNDMAISNSIVEFNIQSYAWKTLSSSYSSLGTCGIGHDNKAYCWGASDNGRLGSSFSGSATKPVAVSQGEIPVDATLHSIETGTDTTCVLDSNGQAYCWGNNRDGQLGINDNILSSTTSPKKVIQDGLNYQDIVVSDDHVCATTDLEKLYCWGDNSNGELAGASTQNTKLYIPTAVPQGAIPSGETIKQVSISGDNTCVLASNNWIYCSGRGDNGRLGNNSTQSKNSFVAIAQGDLTQGAYYTKVITGGSHSCAIANDNYVYCWGENSDGQLGINNQTDSKVPVRVHAGAIPTAAVMQDVMVRTRATCIQADNKLYCFGKGGDGNLGTGNTSSKKTPVAVIQGEVSVSETIEKIYSGYCFVSNDQKAYCFGNNNDGQVGNNSTQDAYSPKLAKPYNN